MIKIQTKEDCCGCSACVSICAHDAIIFEEDELGFCYPYVQLDKCTDCHLCENVCPILRNMDDDAQESSGFVQRAYAAHSNDKSIHLNSSSGGIFLTISRYVIEHGGVVYGALYDENMAVTHGRASDNVEINALSGSKYSQSTTLGVFKQVKEDLKSDKWVLFTGTPCQVDGLRLFLKRDYPNLILIDLICHSVPSPKVFKDYLSFVRSKVGKKVVGFNMRSKEHGWGNNSMRLCFEDGSSCNNKLSNLWSTIYWSGLVLRPSCTKCQYANLNRRGDITIGDFWGVENHYPELVDKRGLSLVFVNSPKGEQVFNSLKDRLNVHQVEQEKCMQPALMYPVKANTSHPNFLFYYSHLPFRYVAMRYWGWGFVNTFRWKVSDLIHKCLGR